MEFEKVLGQITGRSEEPSMIEVHEEKINSMLESSANQANEISDMNGRIDNLTEVTDSHSSQFDKLAEEKAEAVAAVEVAEEETSEAIEAEAEVEEEQASEAEDEAESEKDEEESE